MMLVGRGLFCSLLFIVLAGCTDASEQGSPESEKFSTFSKTLEGKIAPTILIDTDALQHNIRVVKEKLDLAKLSFRLVDKSLVPDEIANLVLKTFSTNKVMVFGLSRLGHWANRRERHDLLLGKPVLSTDAELFLAKNKGALQNHKIHWLVDSLEQAQNYLDLAKKLQVKLNINLEIDVGLHRGGFLLNDFKGALFLLKSNEEWLNITGFMGYDAHVAAAPLHFLKQRAHSAARENYAKFVAIFVDVFGPLDSSFILNSGGSKTYLNHVFSPGPANEIALGSSLLMPADFDIPELNEHQPAVYIATKVLKLKRGIQIPFLERLEPVLQFLFPHLEWTAFVDGGQFQGEYVFPKGIVINPIYGKSQNQEMIHVGAAANLKVNDWVFVRPHQSEGLFQRFQGIVWSRPYDGK